MKQPDRTSKPTGFSLIELVIVVVIIGVVAAIAIPRMSSATVSAQAAAELANARLVLNAVEQYRAVHGELPRDGSPASFPTSLTGLVPPSLFTKTSPAGGYYDWDGPPAHTATPAFKLVMPTGTNASSLDFYAAIEAQADDGLPAAGRIQASGRMIRFYF